jgi:hypothetical protein
MTDKLWGWVRVGLAIVLLMGLFSSHGGSWGVQQANGATTYLTKTWDGRSFIWTEAPWFEVWQNATVTIYYNRTGNRTPHHMVVNRTHCDWTAQIGMTISQDWCGRTILTSTSVDFGLDFTKHSSFFPAEQRCWVRQKAVAAYNYGDNRMLKFLWQGPVAEPWEPRHGCNSIV